MQQTCQHNRRGFTLVELLAVILIMGMLMLFAIPSFQSASRGGRARGAVFQLNTALSLARQTAITSRQNVHVLFPDDQAPLREGATELPYRAYAIYAERDGYVGTWNQLPAGVLFQDTFRLPRETSEALIRNIFLQHERYRKPVRYPTQDDAEDLILALTFQPHGALMHAGFNPRAVYVSDGWIITGTDGAIEDMGFPEEATVYGLEIRPESGQSRVREYNPE